MGNNDHRFLVPERAASHTLPIYAPIPARLRALCGQELDLCMAPSHAAVGLACQRPSQAAALFFSFAPQISPRRAGARGQFTSSILVQKTSALAQRRATSTGRHPRHLQPLGKLPRPHKGGFTLAKASRWPSTSYETLTQRRVHPTRSALNNPPVTHHQQASALAQKPVHLHRKMPHKRKQARKP